MEWIIRPTITRGEHLGVFLKSIVLLTLTLSLPNELGPSFCKVFDWVEGLTKPCNLGTSSVVLL